MRKKNVIAFVAGFVMALIVVILHNHLLEKGKGELSLEVSEFLDEMGKVAVDYALQLEGDKIPAEKLEQFKKMRLSLDDGEHHCYSAICLPSFL